MVEYHYNPDKKKGVSKSADKKVSHMVESFSRNRLGVAIVLVMLALVVFVGPVITGNLLYEDPEYAMLSQNPDFPDFSKQKANVEVYKLRDENSNLELRFSGCESGLSDAQKLYNTCTGQKAEVESQLQIINNDYSLCQDDASSLRLNLDTCNSEKSSKGADLLVCNTQLSDVDTKLSLIESEKARIIENYASGVCCTLKQLSNPSLKYYTIVNNRVVCSDSVGIEFSC